MKKIQVGRSDTITTSWSSKGKVLAQDNMVGCSEMNIDCVEVLVETTCDDDPNFRGNFYWLVLDTRSSRSNEHCGLELSKPG